ncbi:MAG: hypothetical protein ACREJ5_08095 [Geminicoccaceae bacterium]
MTAVMTSAERSEPAARDLISVPEFRGWLARAESCSWFEYHRGLLIWDRSPASALSDDHRRALARIANAVFQAAEQGQVHLVQRRRGPFDFSYLAIKSVRAATRRAVPALAIDRPAAQRSILRSEAA